MLVPGVPHHITQRGNNRQDVFYADDSRDVYLDLLERHAQRDELGVLGYCLMSNHVHLIAVPHREHVQPSHPPAAHRATKEGHWGGGEWVTVPSSPEESGR